MGNFKKSKLKTVTGVFAAINKNNEMLFDTMASSLEKATDKLMEARNLTPAQMMAEKYRVEPVEVQPYLLTEKEGSNE